MKNLVINIFRLIRWKHWVKNTFIFLPLLFAGKIHLLPDSGLILVFISFCLASSSIYIINDIIDKENDILHPVKKTRPIASGFFSIKSAIIILSIVIVLFTFSLLFIPQSYPFVLGYLVLNIIYSFFLKNIPIVDVSSISTGFVLRVMAGGVEPNIFVSHWMIIIVFLLTISLSFAKRRDDLVIDIDNNLLRKSLSGYTISFLDIAKSISFTITIIAYILYSVSAEAIERIGSDKLYLTSLFVFIGIIRYLQLTIVYEKSGSPTELLFKDKFLIITILLWLVTFLFIIYG